MNWQNALTIGGYRAAFIYMGVVPEVTEQIVDMHEEEYEHPYFVSLQENIRGMCLSKTEDFSLNRWVSKKGAALWLNSMSLRYVYTLFDRGPTKVLATKKWGSINRTEVRFRIWDARDGQNHEFGAFTPTDSEVREPLHQPLHANPTINDPRTLSALRLNYIWDGTVVTGLHALGGKFYIRDIEEIVRTSPDKHLVKKRE